jgi:uncharacterized membrane protein
MNSESTTGLSPRLASVLAYGGWWVTGAFFCWIEQRDRYVRFHAAQSMIAFGAAAVIVFALAILALLSLETQPAAFGFLAWSAAAACVAAVLLWMVALWQASRGVRWQMPVVGRLAERLARQGAEPVS